jgi:DNA end-binding protein Ku
MAERLVAEMEGTWKPEEFQDEYRDEVMALVERKVRSGQTHEILEPESGEKRRRARSEVVDLMPLLKKSLEARATSERKASRAGAAPAAVKRGAAARKPARAKAPARKKRTA